ncbi:hypothetical protein FOA52_014703 [Chlamydomonas sp. UWO 241]|nr:hypothetical protein FOA52_014703 [Chlamydomonas sp. UWO 241]
MVNGQRQGSGQGVQRDVGPHAGSQKDPHVLYMFEALDSMQQAAQGHYSFEALMQQLKSTSFGSFMGDGNATTNWRPGQAAAKKGWKAKHPVVIVPGFVTSGLELWAGQKCAQSYFRSRMWGTMGMMQAYIFDKECWFRHMSLDPTTGLDPEGIKVRASQGLESIDYFMQGYWVWSKILESLGDIGYDSNSLVALAFDWRMAVPLMEVRDGYFSRLRSTVEWLHLHHGEKVVLMSHSYGENIARAFYTWAETNEPGWVEEHLEATVNIAGTALGIPKAVTAVLSDCREYESKMCHLS